MPHLTYDPSSAIAYRVLPTLGWQAVDLVSPSAAPSDSNRTNAPSGANPAGRPCAAAR